MSPVRKPYRQNAEAGPSRRTVMEPVGEDDEERAEFNEMPADDEDAVAYRAEVALQQKARILRQTQRRSSTPEAKPGPSREVMAPAKLVVNREPRPQPSRLAGDIGTKLAGEVKPRVRASLFETVASTLVHALEMAQTRTGFHSPGTCSVAHDPSRADQQVYLLNRRLQKSLSSLGSTTVVNMEWASPWRMAQSVFTIMIPRAWC
jgi:hypothetical protein